MTNLIDFILDLFRSPASAASFVIDPDGALRDAGLPNVSAAQLAVGRRHRRTRRIVLGGGDPVYGLQRAVAEHHSIPARSPRRRPSRRRRTSPSHNTDLLASNNDFMQPRSRHAGANAQNGAFNLGFGDITLGDKSTNTATNGGVVVDGGQQRATSSAVTAPCSATATTSTTATSSAGSRLARHRRRGQRDRRTPRKHCRR